MLIIRAVVAVDGRVTPDITSLVTHVSAIQIATTTITTPSAAQDNTWQIISVILVSAPLPMPTIPLKDLATGPVIADITRMEIHVSATTIIITIITTIITEAVM